MDGKATATDAPGSSLFHPSNDYVINSLLKDDALDADNNKASADGESSTSSSSSDGGFVSGEEEFETAPERQGMGDPDEETLEIPTEGDDVVGPCVDSPVVLVAKDFSPIVDVAAVDDDENDDVGDPKMRDFKNSDVVDGGKGLEVDRDEGIVTESEIGYVSGEGKDVTVENEEVEDDSDVVDGGNGLEVDRDEGIVTESEIGYVSGEGKDVTVENEEVENNSDVVDGGKGLEVDRDEGIVTKSEIGYMSSEVKDVTVENEEVEDKSPHELVEGAELMKDGGSVEGNKIEGLVGEQSALVGGTRKESNGVIEENVIVGNKNGSDDVLVETYGKEFASGGKDKGVLVEMGERLREDDSRHELVPEENKLAKDGGAIEGNKSENDGKKSVSSGHTSEESNGVIEENMKGCGENGLVDDKSVEADGMKVTSGGDSVVEALHVDLVSSGVGVVGDDEGHKDFESSAVIQGDRSVSLENEYSQISTDTEKLVESDAEFDKNVEPLTCAGAVEIEADGEKSDVTDLGQNENLYVGGVLNTVMENKDLVAEDEVSVDKSENVGFINNDEELVAEGKTEVDFEAKPSEVDAVPTTKVGLEAEDERNYHHGEEGEIEDSDTDEETEGMVYGSSEVAKQFLEELERGSIGGSHSGAESSHDHSHRIDGQIITDSDEEVDTDDEGEEKELFNSAALEALLKAANGASSDGGNITITSQDGSRLFSLERPAGLGSSIRSMRPAPQSNRPNLFAPASLTTGGGTEINLSEEERETLEKLQQIRVKFLRLVQRLGHSAEDSIVSQVLYRLAFVAGQRTGQLFSLETAKKTATQLDMEGKDDLNFSLNILVLGKSGVGKSATINAIFGQEKALIHAFEPATTSVKELSGKVDGVHIRVIDTPGLKSSAIEQGANRKVLSIIKKFTKKCPPDIVLYVDRLDAQTRDLNDLPLLKTITSSLGSSIWRNVVVALTHAASAPPDGPSGSPLSYEVFVAQRSHVVQQSIGQAVGDLRMINPSLMNPVALVENHLSCRKNRDGQKVLPNGQTWRPQLLVLCYSIKILSEASSVSKPQDPLDQRKLFGFRVRSPPLPYLLSWLLQSRTHPKLSTDQGGDNVDSDIDMADLSDSDEEEGEEYDQLPPFKPLRKAQIAKLSGEQKKAYFEEYDYRVKLLQKKQWREQLKRMREMKKGGKTFVDEYGNTGEDDLENGGPAAVPVPLPDMVLPPSFDGDNPAYRYRFLEPTSQFLARPVLDPHGWDHDCGYEGINVEHSLAIANQFPGAITVQVTKDKKEFNIHLDSSVSAKHGENGSTMAGFDIQNVGKQLAYILRGETKFKNFKKNKTTAGVSVTFLGENVATGIKLDDQIALGKRLMLVGSTGTVRSQSDAAYGANLELRLREADFPIGQDQSSLGLSLVKWRGDLALGANLQSQFSVGRSSKIAVRAGLNNKLSGQISVRTSSSDQLQIALVGLLPIVMSIYKSIRPGVSENYSIY